VKNKKGRPDKNPARINPISYEKPKTQDKIHLRNLPDYANQIKYQITLPL
jgi:hypothetical protein